MDIFRWKSLLVCVVVLVAGCGHAGGDSSTASTTAFVPPELTPPTNPDDVNAWRAFIGESIQRVTHNPNVHPYSYVVPRGDDADSMDRRKGEAGAIRSLLGRTAVPGNMIALTGPDSAKVSEVIVAAFKDLTPSTARGLTVLYVGTTKDGLAAKATVAAAGARLQIEAMRSP